MKIFCKISKMNVKSPKIIDLRSDTVSLPSEMMRKAIYNAEVGDSVFGEDTTVKLLEEKSAKLFGKEEGCFLSSGTMGNLIAILNHCKIRGSEIITGSKSHILLFEQTGAAQFGGVNIREIQNKDDGTFDINELKSKFRPDDIHEPRSCLICVENTHNILGGKIVPLQWLDQLTTFAKSLRIPLHMDGSRIFNASVELNIPVSRIVEGFDSVTFCFSKGLGSPYGSMLVGSSTFIKSARRIQKAIGGGVRQIGFMAAAAIYSLDNMVLRLKDDHENTQIVANVIREMNNPHFIVPESKDIHSNILLIHIKNSKLTSDFMDELQTVSDTDEEQTVIKAFTVGVNLVRFVFYCNISQTDIQHVVTKLQSTIKKSK